MDRADMTTTRETADHAELARDIRALCNGHPHAMISWPHRELHALADRAENLLSEIAALRGQYELDGFTLQASVDRATQAERQRDEAVGLLRRWENAWRSGASVASIVRDQAPLLANQGADQ